MKEKYDIQKKPFWNMTIPELIAAGKGFWAVFPLLVLFQVPLALIAFSATDKYRLVLAIFVFCTVVPAKIIVAIFKW